MATIYDIAELSKTSAATVSYVLNGRGKEKRISQATQSRILEVADRLNYHPNVTARQLKSPTSTGIRIAAFWPSFYFEQPMISAMRAIKNVINVSTDSIEVSLHFYTPDNLSEVWDKLSPVGFNGVILAGASMKDLKHIAGRVCAVPVVLINRSCEGFPSFSIDHREAGRMACDLAIERGAESVLTIWDTRFHVATNLRKTAFFERCEEMGVQQEHIAQYTCEGSEDAGYDLGISLIRKKQLKKVVYCNNESIALGVATALRESDVHFGEDVLLFTANNGPDSFCRYMAPPLTSINLRMREVYEGALKQCLNIILRNEESDSVSVIRPIVQFRESMPEL